MRKFGHEVLPTVSTKKFKKECYLPIYSRHLNLGA